MDDLTVYGLLYLISPLLLGFVLGRFVVARSDWSRAGLALIGAGLPCLFILAETRQADSITSAAALGVVPVIFLILLVPSGLGVHLGSMVRPKS